MPPLNAALDRSLGQRLRALRMEQGLSQRHLAKAIGRTQSEVYRWEKGDVRIPAQNLPALAKALQVSLDQFFTEEEVSTHVA